MKQKFLHALSTINIFSYDSNCSVLGEGNAGVARAIVLFSDALSSSSLEESEEVMKRVVQLMKQIQVFIHLFNLHSRMPTTS